MIDNRCSFCNSGVCENVKFYGYSYRIGKGDRVMLELHTNKRTLYLFVNNAIQTLCITNVLPPCCYLIVFVEKIDKIEFESLLHTFDPTYSVDFIYKAKYVKWFYRKY
jgi:hypothetical protein